MRAWVLTVIVAAAPSLFLLTFFYLKDRYEREPLQHILMAFGLGLYAMIAAHGIAGTAESWVPRDWLLTRRRAGEAVRRVRAVGLRRGAGQVGRADRRRVPLGRVRRAARRRRLRRRGRARLRHAGELPVRRPRWGWASAWQRALFAVPAHALFGATMGYYAGRAKFDQRREAVGAIARFACWRPTAFTAATTTRSSAAWGRTSGS